MIDEPVSLARITLACFVAAVAAPMPMAFALVGTDGLTLLTVLPALFLVTLFGSPVALVHVGLLGVPAFLLLRRRWRLGWWQSAVSGVLIGAVPTALLDGGWQGAALCGLCGLVGGLAFWAVIRGGQDGGPRAGRNPLDEIFA